MPKCMLFFTSLTKLVEKLFVMILFYAYSDFEQIM